jgi:Holliday junction resolvasome RuvABC DNA-binding subunit
MKIYTTSNFSKAKKYECLVELGYKEKPLDEYISPLSYEFKKTYKELIKESV